MKGKVLEEIVELFDKSGKVVNRSKLYTDLYNRERKATTGIGEGVAIPHVRTMQAKDLVVVFARSRKGVEFGAIDGMPVNLFFGVVAPPYNDRVYLEVYRQLGLILRMAGAREALLLAPDEDHIIKIVGDFP
jgi:mannitol/fructose-specific phosphotransferase system IIA component (Ntr-type)